MTESKCTSIMDPSSLAWRGYHFQEVSLCLLCRYELDEPLFIALAHVYVLALELDALTKGCTKGCFSMIHWKTKDMYIRGHDAPEDAVRKGTKHTSLHRLREQCPTLCLHLWFTWIQVIALRILHAHPLFLFWKYKVSAGRLHFMSVICSG